MKETPIHKSQEQPNRTRAGAYQGRLLNQAPGAQSDRRLPDFARLLLSLRRHRSNHLQGIAFGEPAWDMLLDLYVNHIDRLPVSITDLCVAAAVPTTTGLRWVAAMVDQGHFIREEDPGDHRRAFIHLKPEVLNSVEVYLNDAYQRASSMFS